MATHNTDPPTNLRILNINVNKSPEGQLALLNTIKGTSYDIVTLQEPCFDWKLNTRALPGWIVVYPLNHLDSPARTRSVILVNVKLSSNSWTTILPESPDVTGLELKGTFGTLRIFNIYNDCNHNDSLLALDRFLDGTGERPADETDLNDIWIGDFNRHDPRWDEMRNEHLFTNANREKAAKLNAMVAKWHMDMALPEGIPTLESTSTKNYTRVDNVWTNEEFLDNIITCDTIPELRPPYTDHIPIECTIDISPSRNVDIPRLNYRASNWEEINKELEEAFDEAPPPDEITSEADFHSTLDHLMATINTIVHKHTPTIKFSPYMKRWWTSELETMRSKVGKLGRTAYNKHRRPNDPIHEEYRTSRNAYRELIKKTKLNHWLEWLDGIDARTIWTANKFVSAPASDGGKTRVPTLKIKNPNGPPSEASDNASKSKALYKAFFYPPPEHTIPLPFVYPKPKTKFTNISNEQVARAISKLSPYKAPGPDDVSNAIFTHCKEVLTTRLGPIYRATFKLGIYPKQWKIYTTIVLRKPGKPDYSVPKAYRPIALLNTIAKILSSCVAEDLAHMAETHGMLPPTHFGGRPGRTTTDSLHLTTKWIHDQWRSKRVASALFLDISGAYPNVVIPKLIHNMRKRGVPEEYTEWTLRRLQGRQCRLVFDDYKSDLFDVINGVDQGCPLSHIYYLFYSADLLEIASTKSEFAAGFIDDTVLLAAGRTFDETHEILTNMMNREGGANEWSRDHNSNFEVDKFALMDFTRKTIPDPTGQRKTIPTPRPDLVLNGHTIQPSSTHKFLGVIMDQKLSFNAHCLYACAKGEEFMAQAKRLTKPRRGVPGKCCRQILNGIVIPKMLYAADLWCAPITIGKEGARTKGSAGFAIKTGRIQRKATILITGAMRTTASDTLDAHADVLPIHLAINKICCRAALRLATLPTTHPLCKITQRIQRQTADLAKKLPRYPSPLHRIMRAFPHDPGKIESIQATRHTPKWKRCYDIQINPNQDEAMDVEARDRAPIRIYTDGSGFEGGIGAAAVLIRRMATGRTRKRVLKFHLGTAQEHTVYEGELVGLILAQHLLSSEARISVVSLYTDNQASITGSSSIKPTAGHHLMDLFHRKLERLQQRRPALKLTNYWIPSHSGCQGNEMADDEAKKAAQGETSANEELPRELQYDQPLPYSKSAIKQIFNRKFREQAQKHFENSSRYAKLLEIDPEFHPRKYRRMTDSLPRRQASCLTQLRTNHTPLNKHLHRIKCVDSPMCPNCNDKEETVHHYLLMCPKYNLPRRELLATLGRDARSLSTLLSSKEALRPLFKYIARTGRLKETFGDNMELPEEEEKD